jgi:hypothetical protein
MKHKCKPNKICSCYPLSSEPSEKCPVHGTIWPPRCECGKFIKYKRKWGKNESK